MYFRPARSRSLFILASTLGDIGDKRWKVGVRDVKRNKHVGRGGGEADNVIEKNGRDSQHQMDAGGRKGIKE